MFAVVNLDESARAVISFHAGLEHYTELLETDGVIPAPYMARIFWVSLERWDVLPSRELLELLRHARELVYDKLPKRTKDVLALSPTARKKIIREKRNLLAGRKEKKSQ